MIFIYFITIMKELSEQIDDYSFDENENKVKSLLKKYGDISSEYRREDFSNCYDNLVRFE